MTAEKSRLGRRAKDTRDHETTWLKTDETANAIRELIVSMGMSAEQKITK